ncbi:uncharacterized protein LOC111332504 isoform X2 [Stylophora pistillata]|uniref:uncharacterized protein LOC111332504 isoform X2 n=1 Tax=Stylophora pistillata TaxID=50429 RepID=UPI000C055EA4|nr:uncharacterized protein LOC111332504 isoform X2 [Stylophora pistillata]
MHSDYNLLLDCQKLQMQFILVYLVMTLRQVTAGDCAYSAVAKNDPCFGLNNHVTEERCRRLSEECCVYTKRRGMVKCLRTKEKQPNKGGCNKVSLIQSRPLSHQFLEGDVLLELKVVSELHCWDCCMRHQSCKAYNYYQANDPSLENCQLLKSDIGQLTHRESHTYYVLSKQYKDLQILLGSTCH